MTVSNGASRTETTPSRDGQLRAVGLGQLFQQVGAPGGLDAARHPQPRQRGPPVGLPQPHRHQAAAFAVGGRRRWPPGRERVAEGLERAQGDVRRPLDREQSGRARVAGGAVGPVTTAVSSWL